MMRIVFIQLFFTCFIGGVSGQSLKNKIYKKFNTADSVILVSHSPTYTPIVDEKTNERIGFLKLVEQNKPNAKIIRQQHRLNKKEIDSVSAILSTPNTDSIIHDNKCFIPHHGILIFKKKKCSYFDICFGCRHFITSKDIKLSDELSRKTWDELESFFRSRKLDYELSETETTNDQ
jgi:hypothetical protein